MKHVIGAQFQLDVPEGWTEFRQRSQFVFQGPGPGVQELIIQGHLVDTDMPGTLLAQALAQLTENAHRGITSVLDDADLEVERAFEADPSLPAQPAWSAVARAKSDGALFCGAVFQARRGVLLLTYESALGAADRVVYERIASSVSHVAERANT